MPRTVVIDENSGFCFGVINAIQTAEDYLREHHSLFCLGDIVHNNEEVRRLLALRGNERAENAAYDLKSARQATDEAYENLVERINAIALINPSESWNTFIAQWSAEIARIKQQILSQTTQTGDDEGGTTPSGGDDGGNETPTGGGTDTGGGDTPPSGGDDNTGEGDPPPFSGTDQN